MTEPLLPQSWIVREVKRETADIQTLLLQPAAATAPIHARPGQFNMLYAFGIGEVPVSISGDTSDGLTLLHTIRDVGPVTHALCGLEQGDVVGVRGPFGSHWPIEQHATRDIVVVAGGIGLAPLRPVLYHIVRHRERYDDVVLLYGARRPEELLFTAEFAAWRKAGIQIEVTVDSAGPAWRGRIGVVTTLVRYGKFEHEQACAFICGPEIMLRFAAQELEHKGIAADQQYVSMERNMKCAVGYCGHCQLGPEFVCKDGAVFALPRVKRLMMIREL